MSNHLIDRRVRILFIVASLAYGGAEKQLISLINSLNSKRYRISLAYLKAFEGLLPQIDQAKLEGRLFCCSVQDGIELHAVSRVAEFLEKEKIDLIVCVNCYAYIYGVLARFYGDCNSSLLTIFHSFDVMGKRDKIRTFLIKPLFRLCDTVIYVCKKQQQYWNENGLKASNSTVIYNGVDVDYFFDAFSAVDKSILRGSLGFTQDDFVIGICAGLRPEKAHHLLIDAMNRLPGNYRHVKGLFIGDGPERQRLEEKIHEVGLQDRIVITGFQDDVRPFISICDAMALVSYSEAFSLAALESMAMAKPLIMSNVGGASEQIEHGVHGFLFRSNDLDELAMCIQKLCTPGMASLMGVVARERAVYRFSLESMSRAYGRFLDGCAAFSAPGVIRRQTHEN